MAIDWQRPKDPSEIVDYAHDWSGDLGDDTIDTSAWEAVNAAGTSQQSASFAGAVARIFFAGGTDGQTAVWVNRITTAGGRTLEQAFRLRIVDTATIPALPSDLDTLRQWLGEAKAARHKLATGQIAYWVERAGRRMRYSAQTIEALDSYIEALEREIAAAEAGAAGQPKRRAIALGWRN